MSTKPTSGIHGDGRRRASSRGSSTSQQPTQRRGNRRVVKAEPLRLPSLRLPPVGAWLRAVIGPARGRLLRGALVLGGAAALAVGLELGWRALTTSPMFALDEISVVGNTRAPEAELWALAAVELGDNAIALSTDDVAKALEKHPWVAEAHALRRLPRGLTLEVREHVPVALVALENLYFVDADGEVVKRLVPGELEALPVITGLSRQDVEAGEAVALSQVRAALGFIDVWSSREPGVTLDEVHVAPAGEISIGLADEAVRVHLGPAPWDDAIQRYHAVREEAALRGFVAAEVSAWSSRYPDRAVVRLASAGAPQIKERAPSGAAPREAGEAR